MWPSIYAAGALRWREVMVPACWLRWVWRIRRAVKVLSGRSRCYLIVDLFKYGGYVKGLMMT